MSPRHYKSEITFLKVFVEPVTSILIIGVLAYIMARSGAPAYMYLVISIVVALIYVIYTINQKKVDDDQP